MNTPSPNCPACAVAMVEGFIPDRADGWARTVGFWVEGQPEMSAFGNAKVDGRPRYTIEALRCPECGLVQLYATKRTYSQ